ncbi:MAG: ribonuclease HII [Firmicutes bacterium HGW-Firmicutes-21]|nr:MAG: ribonuclease HII [Firmicutes bacterium HGW-Firmicutes-21]
MINWELQNTFYSDSVSVICGCDEAGRGPLAGPVFAAAVILPQGHIIEGLDDSKRLSHSARDALFDRIKKESVAYSIAHAEVYEIEAINILNASMLAMRRAVGQLDIKPDLALVDGNIVRDFPLPAHPVIKGDGKIPCIAAASVLAKVARDRFCSEMDSFYPGYNFARNKGYATKEHKAAILKIGPCPVHRRSFLRKTLGDSFEQHDIWQSW